ncbi:MAG: DEAD/DEAH box helicase [Polyangiales bacterium]|nr:DEAD/DEAH box helicase [Myxococcales bacterium]
MATKKTPRSAPLPRPTAADAPELVTQVGAVATFLDDGFSRSALYEAVNRAGVRDASSRRLTSEFVQEALWVLQQRGDVAASEWDPSCWCVPEDACWRNLERAHEAGLLGPITDALAEERRRYRQYTMRVSRGEVRAALVLGRVTQAIGDLSRSLQYVRKSAEVGAAVLHTLGHTPKATWVAQLSEPLLDSYANALLDGALASLSPIEDDLLVSFCEHDERAISAKAARVAVMRGLPVEDVLATQTALGRAEIQLFAALMASDVDTAGVTAIAHEHLERVQGKGVTNARRLSDEVGVAFGLVALVAGTVDSLQRERLQRRIEALGRKMDFEHFVLAEFLRWQLSGDRLQSADYPDTARLTWVQVLLLGLLHSWAGTQPVPQRLVRHLAAYAHLAERSGYTAAAKVFNDTQHALHTGDARPGSFAATYRSRRAWELTLDALESVAEAVVAPDASEAKGAFPRVVWEVSVPTEKRALSITPRLVKSARAQRGTVLNLEKLQQSTEPYVTPSVREVLGCAEMHRVALDPWGKRKETVISLGYTALLQLVDDPHVVDSEGAPLRIVRAEGELRAERTASGEATTLSLHPPELLTREFHTERVPPDMLAVYARTPELTRVASLLAMGKVEIPRAGEGRLGRVLSRVGQRVRVSAGQDIELAGRSVEADPRLAFLCRWSGQRLDVRLRAIPLGLGGPHLPPGQGQAQRVATLDGETVQTVRDLAHERDVRRRIFAATPLLDALDWHDDATSLEGMDLALAFLADVALVDSALCILAWPDGKTLPSPVTLGMQQLRVRVRQTKDELISAIQLEVDEGLVVELQQLIDAWPGRGRFVHLAGDRVLALSDELRRRLDALSGLGAAGKKGLETPLVMLPRLVELTEAAGHRTLDANTQASLERLQAALTSEVPLPAGFGAELRDYQLSGYVWMARLANAELGACLADDMGLGKTVQSLALLTQRAKLGPALVVAPTSVVGAWTAEAQRFASNLNVITLAESQERAGVLAAAGPFDVLICSYGVLVTEQEALTTTRFATVVFDEAHALKNAQTQRAKAAAELDAGFRLALTGTPVENHLGELWSLMRCVLPGLLGSERQFTKQFVEPIANGHRERLQELRARMRPFLLRRTKSEVLEELPERSETTLLVTPTPEERAFYEALRRKAEDAIAAQRASGDGSARIKLLTEILKLRQAAVDPRVLNAEGPAGAKLEVLTERVLALHEEGHQALVFTQFLDMLGRVEQRLSAEGLRVLTLDGSLSAKARTAQVAAFQAGEADVFVMSLHAGGVGVTLTAADYVFHLDPWWNPAVEDQATGRAHRIGQKRPVHVYRLITAGTLEEKILALHGTKRQLSGDLLEGLDEAKKLDLETLRELLT